MELQDVLQIRRSVRRFTDTPLTDEQVERLMHAAMSGPSACNRIPWAFYVVRDPELLAQLRGATRFSNITAPAAIVVCGDLGRALPLSSAEFWVQDCSAATENILLCATDLGLGAVWCGLYPQKKQAERVAQMLQVEEKYIPLNIIYIGTPAEQPKARDQYDAARVYYR